MQLCNDEGTELFASCWFRHDLPTLDWYFIFLFKFSASLHLLSVWKSSSHSSSSSSESAGSQLARPLVHCENGRIWRKKIKRSTSCEEVEKFWHYHCWQWYSSGSVALMLTRSLRIACLSLEEAQEVVKDRDYYGVATRTAWPSPYTVMSTRMRPTHNSLGNDAELRVLLLKWCRKKGDLWRVESQLRKPQFKICSVTFAQICFLCTTISAVWGKL